MDNQTKHCQTGCDLGYAEPTSRFCVLQCFGSPQTFAHIPSATCVYKCKTPELGDNLYADNSSYTCVAFDGCSAADDLFSDPISGNCVKFCPEGLYAETVTRTCTDRCINSFADNLTRSCVVDCPEAPEDTYGDVDSAKCLKICPDGKYARNDTQTCVLET